MFKEIKTENDKKIFIPESEPPAEARHVIEKLVEELKKRKFSIDFKD